MEQNLVDEYVEFVMKSMKDFEKIGNLIQGSEIPPARVNYALSMYYDTCLALNTEYQRWKIQKLNAELEYDAIYADWFAEAKAILVAENSSKSAKPALKEIEQQVKTDHKEEYYSWQRKLTSLEAKCDFYIRLREILNKYDNVLTNLAMSLRSELRALNIESRANVRNQFSPKTLAEQASSLPVR